MEEPEFKPFHKTFQIITVALSIGMIYPNPATDRIRLVAISIFIMTAMPFIGLVLLDMYQYWKKGDIINIIRHSTIIGPFLGGLLKVILMYHKRVQAKQILDEFNRDFRMYNRFIGNYRKTARDGIRNSVVYSERGWTITVITCVMTFIIMAIVLNMYNFTFKSEPVKYMIHDINKPGSSPEARFDSPYYELMFVYMCYNSVFYLVNFIGYDGFFGLSINHACMKMNLLCKMLDDALKADPGERYVKVVEVIEEQCRMFKFVNMIQDTFNIWLGVIFMATIIQICTNLYHVIEGYGFDLRYTIFVTGAVIHIYLPCRYAAKLKAMSTETASHIYCTNWERVHDHRIRKMVLFMITRAQVPLQITAFNMIKFDMKLFVSIMQSSYSMFTLLKS